MYWSTMTNFIRPVIRKPFCLRELRDLCRTWHINLSALACNLYKLLACVKLEWIIVYAFSCSQNSSTCYMLKKMGNMCGSVSCLDFVI